VKGGDEGSKHAPVGLLGFSAGDCAPWGVRFSTLRPSSSRHTLLFGAAMPLDSDHSRAREIADAWRSRGAHELARALVSVAREEGAGEKLQRVIAAAVIANEEPATEEDLAYALRA
jgi:hypothetical protein